MNRNRCNEDIKRRAKESGVCLWEIAEKMGISNCWFTVKLRKEFSEEEKQRVFGIIDEISKEGQ